MHYADGLKVYASSRHPDRDLPPDVYLLHDSQTITVFDKFPKGKYHFLVMPRLPFRFSDQAAVDMSPTDSRGSRSESDSYSGTSSTSSSRPDVSEKALTSLHSLLSSLPAPTVLRVLETLHQASLEVVEMVKDEMLKTEGFEWGIQVGFHAVPSMRHLHLHVVSTDFIATTLRNKKHYASFHPTYGFFIRLVDVLKSLSSRPGKNDSSFDLDKFLQPNGPKSFDRLLGPKSYEHILTNDLSCWQCNQIFPNMPVFKRHLEEEWAHLKKASQKSKG